MKRNNLELSIFIILSMIGTGCVRPDLGASECDELAMHAFRGWPHALDNYNKGCSKIAHHYTREMCQEALHQMIQGKRETELQKQFGDQIMKCFNESDKKKFLFPAPIVIQKYELIHPSEDKGSGGDNHAYDKQQ